MKVVDDDGFIYPEAAVCGFVWAADHGMQITNNSYFIDPWNFNCRNDARQGPIWQAVQREIRYAQSKGVLTVASAGNSNVHLQHKFIDSGSPDDGSSPVETREINAACLDLPAEAPGVVTVSALGTERLKSYYSSYGQGVVDVSAPGGDTRQPDPTVSTISHAVLSTVINTTTKVNGWGYLRARRWRVPMPPGWQRSPSRLILACSRRRWRRSSSGPPRSCRARRACTTRAREWISTWPSAPAGPETASMARAR